MIIKCLLMIVSLILFVHSAEGQAVLEAYVEEALQNNIALKNEKLSYQQSLEALKEARGAFFPTLALAASYRTAQGQNPLGLETGDIANSLTSNLDLINQTLGELVPTYPDIPLYSENSTDLNNTLNQNQQTAIVLSVPIFNAAIIQKHKLRKEVVKSQNISVETYKRSLTKEVKIAYMQYIGALGQVAVAEESVKMANRTKAASQTLYQNDRATRDDITSSEVGLQQTRLTQIDAEKNVSVARTYFNFLLNVEQDRAIDSVSIEGELTSLPMELSAYLESVKYRPEIKQLESSVSVFESQTKINRAAYLPNVTLGAEAGYRGTEYDFNSENDYMQMGLQLRWNLYTGGRSRSDIAQSQFDESIATNKKVELLKQLQLATTNAYYEVLSSWEKLAVTNLMVTEAYETYQMLANKYQNGKASLFDLQEAASQYLNAQEQRAAATLDYLSKKIILNYEAGL